MNIKCINKNIAGKELIFWKGRRYLKENVVDKGAYITIFKGKNLEIDKIVTIKEIDYNDNYDNENIVNKIETLKIFSIKLKIQLNNRTF